MKSKENKNGDYSLIQINPEKKEIKNINFFLSILFFLCLFLVFFVCIQHKSLKDIEKKMNSFLENKKTQKDIFSNYLENSNEFENQSNNYEKGLKNQFLNDNLENKIFEENREEMFYPSNLNKFSKLDQLIGLKEEKLALERIIYFLRNIEDYQQIGEFQPPKGILFYGVPGTGKTTLARSLAKETNLPFFEVPSSLFSQKYKGLAPQMVKDLFHKARCEANKNRGAIIFLDECEAIFSNLETLENGSEIINVVNQFKIEMTSLEEDPKKPVFIIGATNHIRQIDPAIQSRFPYHVEIKPGNKEERKIFLEHRIQQRKNVYSPEAKQYLFEVINEFIERLPSDKEFLKTNRTLENMLNDIVLVFAQNRIKEVEQHHNNIPKRKEISKEDLKQAFKIVFKMVLIKNEYEESPLTEIEKDVIQQKNKTS
jgi:SpoVK/Ycf46/Vps4 family AAA+-type ATPase